MKQNVRIVDLNTCRKLKFRILWQIINNVLVEHFRITICAIPTPELYFSLTTYVNLEKYSSHTI